MWRGIRLREVGTITMSKVRANRGRGDEHKAAGSEERSGGQGQEGCVEGLGGLEYEAYNRRDDHAAPPHL